MASKLEQILDIARQIENSARSVNPSFLWTNESTLKHIKECAELEENRKHCAELEEKLNHSSKNATK